MRGPAVPVCCGLVVSGKQIVDEGLFILKLAKHHLHVCHSHTKLDGQLDSMDRWTLSQQISLVLVPVLMSANYPQLPATKCVTRVQQRGVVSGLVLI